MVQHTAIIATTVDKLSGPEFFPHPYYVLLWLDWEWYVEYDFQNKTPFFLGFESKDALEFIVDCHERLHKMGVMEQHGVEFVTSNYRVILSSGGGLKWSFGLWNFLYWYGLNFTLCFLRNMCHAPSVAKKGWFSCPWAGQYYCCIL